MAAQLTARGRSSAASSRSASPGPPEIDSRSARPSGLKLGIPKPASAAALTPRRTSSTGNREGKDHISVAVRFRPLSDREIERGDREVWGVVAENTVGVKQEVGVRVKYSYDTVFDNAASNKQVYKVTSEGIVASAMDGINGTIFAYGVTSSGKTHTMMGDSSNPGIIMRAIRDVFAVIEQTPSREFLLRLSMMEIYNEVLNDLLDPSRTNLKLREDARKGFFVESIKEETLVSAEHALSVIAAGDANRKVGATAYNEGSSRSHTILRLSVESSARPDADVDPNNHVARTLSFLNLIDLAGSESAKAAQSKGQSREGSYINKSLLTLSTVIAKLSDGNAAHIPFRDSKLTRLLQNSLTGSGAKIAVLCTITPASSQAEETHNTLKFATRAKKIEIVAQRNEIMDQSSLIMRYQSEIQQLRSQLESVTAQRSSPYGPVGHDPLHPEVRNLRERLEEEHQALLKREADKVALESRLARLTRIILHATTLEANRAARKRQRQTLLRSFSASEPTLQEACSAVASCHQRQALLDAAMSSLASGRGAAEAESSPTSTSGSSDPKHRRLDANGMEVEDPTTPPASDRPPWGVRGDIHHGIAAIRGAGDLFMGDGLLRQVDLRAEPQADEEAEFLREQVMALAEEIQERDREIHSLRIISREDSMSNFGDMEGRRSVGSVASEDDGDRDVARQLLYAEREFMSAQLRDSNQHASAVLTENDMLRQQLIDAGITPVEAPALTMGDGRASMDSINDEIFADANRLAAELEDTDQPRPAASAAPHRDSLLGRRVLDGEVMEKLEIMEQKVHFALSTLKDKDEQLARERRAMERGRIIEASLESQLRDVTAENQAKTRELERLEMQVNHMQGYGTDNMSAEELSDLIGALTQAVERVRITVQLRRLQNANIKKVPSAGSVSSHSSPDKADGTSAMSNGPSVNANGRPSTKPIMTMDALRKAVAGLSSPTKPGPEVLLDIPAPTSIPVFAGPPRSAIPSPTGSSNPSGIPTAPRSAIPGPPPVNLS
ncbi:hypothetical protein WJX72_000928 [[Myrmecia] bisecta]|uniref:Kinesin motor domain-containing protein n=1 Tax=[Myrmecia] bisecta TaxID=41462 RepID=A0AAW1Q3C8_9CHLO